jgi:PiT family inorganic phosphate transporter
MHSASVGPYVLLGVALLIALGFEFVNGFHDTANAVATVIYTHSLEPHVAVVWSGMWNFLGVVLSSGAVAFGIVSLLPVELILQVGSKAGFAMVFALLVAAIIWNLGTWYFGLPSSSSHTLIGSIIGVGIANQLMSVKSGTSGVDWGQAANIGKSLVLSPIVGFVVAGGLLLLMRKLIPNKALYEAPKGDQPPPFWIRALLVTTCTGVSFFHGSNDGQKGMGLIMLILIGTVPTAYAVNHAVTYSQSQDFAAVSTQTAEVLDHYVSPSAVIGDPRDEVTDYIRLKQFTPNTMLALRSLVNGIGTEISQYGELKGVPQDKVRNFRNDMYVVSESPAAYEEDRPATIFNSRRRRHRELQETHRQRYEVYPDVGKGRGSDRAGLGNDDRLETHRGDSWRKNWQGAPNLRTRSGCRNHRDGDDRSRRRLRTTRQYDARAFFRRGRHHGGQSFGFAMGHDKKSVDGLGAHLTCVDMLVSDSILDFYWTEPLAASDCT